MEKFKVRVPVGGYVEIEVEADTRLDAMQKAYNNFKE